MKKYVYVGAGGILGAISRYIIEHIEISNYKGNIPLNTLAINILGSFVLALILTASYEAFKLNKYIKLSITTGFLGAFTTFSTMCKEIVRLINSGHFYLGIFYMVLYAILGLFAAYLGNTVGKNASAKVNLIKDTESETASDYDSDERNK